MTTPYIGEIRMFAGNFAPQGWELCWGQSKSISENDALFALIGTTYGGDGQETFNLPDLRGRVPVHMGTLGGNTYQIGEASGTETVTLTVQQVPSHTHAPTASSTGNSTSPAGNVWANSPALQFVEALQPNLNATLPANAMSITGGNQPHDNMIPYLAINFIIAMVGVFPSQS
jgi:microcystin-dependent protein